MPTFPKLQRNISYKNYLTDLILAFVLALLNSEFIYFPLLIGLFITINIRLSFIIPFLFFTETSHNFPYFSLIIFYFIYRNYIYPILYIKIEHSLINYVSIILVYLLYFSLLSSYYTIQDKSFHIHIMFIIYYILIEEILLLLDKRI